MCLDVSRCAEFPWQGDEAWPALLGGAGIGDAAAGHRVHPTHRPGGPHYGPLGHGGTRAEQAVWCCGSAARTILPTLLVPSAGFHQWEFGVKGTVWLACTGSWCRCCGCGVRSGAACFVGPRCLWWLSSRLLLWLYRVRGRSLGAFRGNLNSSGPFGELGRFVAVVAWRGAAFVSSRLLAVVVPRGPPSYCWVGVLDFGGCIAGWAHPGFWHHWLTRA